MHAATPSPVAYTILAFRRLEAEHATFRYEMMQRGIIMARVTPKIEDHTSTTRPEGIMITNGDNMCVGQIGRSWVHLDAVAASIASVTSESKSVAECSDDGAHPSFVKPCDLSLQLAKHLPKSPPALWA